MLWEHLGHLHWDWLLRDMIWMLPCCLESLCFYRLWLSVLYHSWGLYTFIEPPLISPVGLVSWLQNWSMTGNSGRSLFLHQFWMTALLDKGSLAACFSLNELLKCPPTLSLIPGLCRQVWHNSDTFALVCEKFLCPGHFQYCILGSNICELHYEVTWHRFLVVELGRCPLCL